MKKFSHEDIYCATCNTSREFHEEILKKNGEIRYAVLRNLTATSYHSNYEEFPKTIDFDVKICRKFDPVYQIFDKNDHEVFF